MIANTPYNLYLSRQKYGIFVTKKSHSMLLFFTFHLRLYNNFYMYIAQIFFSFHHMMWQNYKIYPALLKIKLSKSIVVLSVPVFYFHFPMFTGNGSIDFEEFVAMMAKKLKEMDTEHEMKDAFGCVSLLRS